MINPLKPNAAAIIHKSFIQAMVFYGENIDIEESKIYFINYLNKKQSFIKYNIKVELILDVIIFKREI